MSVPCEVIRSPLTGTSPRTRFRPCTTEESAVRCRCRPSAPLFYRKSFPAPPESGSTASPRTGRACGPQTKYALHPLRASACVRPQLLRHPLQASRLVQVPPSCPLLLFFRQRLAPWRAFHEPPPRLQRSICFPLLLPACVTRCPSSFANCSKEKAPSRGFPGLC